MNPEIRPRCQRLAAGAVLGWHSHRAPYVALLLEGGYAEAGDRGRRRATAGHVIVHPPFAAHWDIVGSRGAVVVNLPLKVRDALRLQPGTVADPEVVLQRYAEEPSRLGQILEGAIAPADAAGDLPDILAAELSRPSATCLADWAEANGVSLRTSTRNFSAAFGIPPAHYRWRARTRAAWCAVVTTERPLVDIAHEWGFADQAHMTRSVRRLTGWPPGRWRQANPMAD